MSPLLPRITRGLIQLKRPAPRSWACEARRDPAQFAFVAVDHLLGVECIGSLTALNLHPHENGRIIDQPLQASTELKRSDGIAESSVDIVFDHALNARYPAGQESQASLSPSRLASDRPSLSEAGT